MSHDVQIRKTPQGYLIKVVVENLRFVVTTPQGNPEILEGGIVPIPTPRVIFLGKDFILSHFPLGDLTFVNTKERKMVIPYQHGNIKEMKSIAIPVESWADMHPVIIYHFQEPSELSSQAGLLAISKHMVIDESIPKGDMVGFKIRNSHINMYIQKKKLG